MKNFMKIPKRTDNKHLLSLQTFFEQELDGFTIFAQSGWANRRGLSVSILVYSTVLENKVYLPSKHADIWRNEATKKPRSAA